MRTILQIGIALGMFLFMTGLNSYAQVSINNDGSQPDSSAMLDVKSGNKGFLPPRIALSAIYSAVPVTSPAIGLLVYNTANAGTSPNNVVPGYYYWNGARWFLLSIPQGTEIGQMLYWNGSSWIPLRSYINVLSFGVDNTGVTDATSAIQNALNAIPAGGGNTIFSCRKIQNNRRPDNKSQDNFVR